MISSAPRGWAVPAFWLKIWFQSVPWFWRFSKITTFSTNQKPDEIILNSDHCFYTVGYTNYNLIQIDFNWICQEILASFFYSEDLIIVPFSVLGLIYHFLFSKFPPKFKRTGSAYILVYFFILFICVCFLLLFLYNSVIPSFTEPVFVSSKTISYKETHHFYQNLFF
jgi:hypothetical protein